MTRRTRLPQSNRRQAFASIDALKLLRELEEEPTSNAWWTQYRDLLAQFLEDAGEPTRTVAQLVAQIDDCLLEDVSRRAGFVLGFDTCRRVLLGEIEVKTDRNGGAA